MKIKLQAKPYGKFEAEVYNNIYDVKKAGFEFDRIVIDSILCDYLLFTKFTRTGGEKTAIIISEFAVIPCAKFDF